MVILHTRYTPWDALQVIDELSYLVDKSTPVRGYSPLMESERFELSTSAVQGQRSPRLSYGPKFKIYFESLWSC